MDEHYLTYLLEKYPVEHFWRRLSDIVTQSDAKRQEYIKLSVKQRRKRT